LPRFGNALFLFDFLITLRQIVLELQEFHELQKPPSKLLDVERTRNLGEI